MPESSSPNGDASIISGGISVESATNLTSSSTEAPLKVEPVVEADAAKVDTELAKEIAAEPKPGDPVEEAVAEAKAKEASNEAAQAKEREQKDLFTKKFTALSHKEKELKQREAKLEEKLKEFQSADMLKSQLKETPLKLLEEAGISYEDLTEMVLNEGSPTTEMMLKKIKEESMSEIEKLRQEYIDDKKAEETAKYEQTLENFQNEIVSFVNDNEDYEFIRAQDRSDLVYEVIDLHHEETGRILDIKEAADAVEQHLYDKAKELAKIKKLGFKLTEEQQEQLDDSGIEDSSSKQENKSVTLSNEQTTQVPNRREKKLTREESLNKAAALIRWED